MEVCSICGKNQDSTKGHTVYTARNLGETSQKWWGGTDITTQFGEFEQHTFRVCRSCSIKRNYVFTLGVYLISIPIIIPVLSTDFGGALFFALFPAGFAFWKFNVTSALIKIAISNRRRTDSNTTDRSQQTYMSDYKGYAYLPNEMQPESLKQDKSSLPKSFTKKIENKKTLGYILLVVGSLLVLVVGSFLEMITCISFPMPMLGLYLLLGEFKPGMGNAMKIIISIGGGIVIVLLGFIVQISMGF